MKTMVTTSRKYTESQLEMCQSIERDFGFEYIKRMGLTAKQLIERNELDVLLIVEKERIVLRTCDDSMYWHPNTSKLKIKSIEKGDYHPLKKAVDFGDKSILDCTMGLGSDTLVLSRFNTSVTALEVSPHLYVLTSQGLKGILNVTCIHANYDDYLDTCEMFDVVYFDPMFEITKYDSNSMQVMKQYTYSKLLDEKSIKKALDKCLDRVVVKMRRGDDIYAFDEYIGGKYTGDVTYGVIHKKPH